MLDYRMQKKGDTMTKTATLDAIVEHGKQPLVCVSVFSTMLAVVDKDGISLWCRYCRVSHFYTKQQILDVWSQLDHTSSLVCKNVI